MNRSRLLAVMLCAVSWSVWAGPVPPVVEIEEDIYSYTAAHNGAGPHWDHGSTNLVRIGEQVFVSGLDTLPDVPPLNNTQCRLWRRDANGWQPFALPDSGQTREPCPLAAFPARQQLFLSANPTLNPPGTAGRGPAKPTILRFAADDAAMAPTMSLPLWREGMSAFFTEHSYRSLAADGERGELILFQNVGHDRAEWTFRDGSGAWPAQGQLNWPRDRDYEPARPIRVCYPNVLLDGRSIHFVGVSDIVEPNDAWRGFKRELTGKDWDYVFRRLFFTWTPDIAGQEFSDWLEIANREKTAGRITFGDLWRAPDGLVHVVWEETALDTRLRARFFPNKEQRWELNHAVLRAGEIVSRHTLAAVDEGNPAPIPHLPRFHVTPAGRLFVFFYVEGTNQAGKAISENRLMEINRDGSVGSINRVALATPLNMYMTASGRTGSTPSRYLDLLGTPIGNPNTLRYARVRIE
jgi:hypothetical protein